MTASQEVDWNAYSAAYDLMAEHNLAYQEIVRRCLTAVRSWD